MKFEAKYIFIFVLLSVIGCQKPMEKEKPSLSIPVKVSRTELKDFYETLDYVGDIKAQDEVIVYPKVSGKIIEKTKEEGNNVAKGEPIAFIDRDEVGLKFERSPVESPLNAVVGKIFVDIGTNVTPQAPVALVVNMDKVKISLDIPEKYLPRISLKQIAKISVDAYAKEEFTGEVTQISPVIDLATRSARIEITVDNSLHLLKSGMFSRVGLIIQEHKNVPVTLKEAILGKEPNLYVYIIEENKALLKNITLGIRKGAYFEVKEGLKGGDLVVIVGQQRLYEGAQVTAEEKKE
jgi:membrane fusion protein, multidrug efflux system